MKLIINCKDIHTKRLVKEHIEYNFDNEVSSIINKIIVCGNVTELNRIEDKIYTVADMWKDIKINSIEMI